MSTKPFEPTPEQRAAGTITILAGLSGIDGIHANPPEVLARRAIKLFDALIKELAKDPSTIEV